MQKINSVDGSIFSYRLRFRSSSVFVNTAVIVLLLFDGICQPASGACDFLKPRTRSCPENFTYVQNGNKCLLLVLKQPGPHPQVLGVLECVKMNSYLVTIASKQENEGVTEFLHNNFRSRRKRAQYFWIGSHTNYGNFDPGVQTTCAVTSHRGARRRMNCHTSVSGSICEVYPELSPHRPTISVSGVTITDGEMRVEEMQQITVNCKAKLGTQGKLKFVRKFEDQTWLIDEFSHILVQRSQDTEMMDGKCYIVGYAQLTFYAFRDLAGSTVGCVSQDTGVWWPLCTHLDRFCRTLPGVFRVDTPEPVQPQKIDLQPETFPFIPMDNVTQQSEGLEPILPDASTFKYYPAQKPRIRELNPLEPLLFAPWTPQREWSVVTIRCRMLLMDMMRDYPPVGQFPLSWSRDGGLPAGAVIRANATHDGLATHYDTTLSYIARDKIDANRTITCVAKSPNNSGHKSFYPRVIINSKDRRLVPEISTWSMRHPGYTSVTIRCKLSIIRDFPPPDQFPLSWSRCGGLPAGARTRTRLDVDGPTRTYYVTLTFVITPLVNNNPITCSAVTPSNRGSATFYPLVIFIPADPSVGEQVIPAVASVGEQVVMRPSFGLEMAFIALIGLICSILLAVILVKVVCCQDRQ